MSNFDFLAAINGEPIYCNGEQVYPYYSTQFQIFTIHDERGNLMAEWDKNGWFKWAKHFSNNLTTDPPKKKVKKTVKIRLFRSHDGSIQSTTHISNQFPSEKILKDFETEIEVEE